MVLTVGLPGFPKAAGLEIHQKVTEQRTYDFGYLTAMFETMVAFLLQAITDRLPCSMAYSQGIYDSSIRLFRQRPFVLDS